MRLTAIILLLLTGISALFAGYSFMTDPSGSGIGINVDYLRYSAFKDFFIPGIVLFSVNGILSITVAVSAIFKHRYHHSLITIMGSIYAGWIFIQVLMVRDFNLLHFIILAIGIILVFLGKRLKNNNQ